MFQLMFNHEFDAITREIPHWEKEEDIPQPIRNFIIEISNKRVIYEKSTKKFYCGTCLAELENQNYCKKCDRKYKAVLRAERKASNKEIKIIEKLMFSKIKDLEDTYDYFAFDIVGENVILYHLKEDVKYDNPFMLLSYKQSSLIVDLSSSYYVEKEGITNLRTKEFISFKNLEEYNNKLEKEELEDKEFREFEEIYLNSYLSNFYTENLSSLKDTIYKYSKLWELKDYLKKERIFSISQFTMNPLFYSSFEYLVNYKLYDLAWQIPEWFKRGKNFKERIGVDKKYLPFMSENNITVEEFKIMQMYPTTDREILRFFKNYSWNMDRLKKENLDLGEVKKYLESENLSSHFLEEYFDYLTMASELNLDLKDKRVVYPSNLKEAHDKLYNQIEVVNDPVIEEKIKRLSTILSMNTYEDEKYLIYPASSIEDLVEESRQQKNCVRTYCEMVAKNESQIYFMRKKTELDKSLVTIEVQENHIVQARVKYNELPNEDLMSILNKWEQTLIPIINVNS